MILVRGSLSAAGLPVRVAQKRQFRIHCHVVPRTSRYQVNWRAVDFMLGIALTATPKIFDRNGASNPSTHLLASTLNRASCKQPSKMLMLPKTSAVDNATKRSSQQQARHRKQQLRQHTRFLAQVREREAQLSRCSLSELRERLEPLAGSFRTQPEARWANLLRDDSKISESFALIGEAVRRTTEKTFYDVQLIAGLALVQGRVAEMQTGEGKTLTTALPAFTLSLFGKGVHVATTNFYLAQRDSEELRPALELLGLSVGLLPEEHDTATKQHAYQADVTFGTGYEFGFDFLRDQIALRRLPELKLGRRHRARISGRVFRDTMLLQRPHTFAIVDEADSVLVDEATMPLVLSMAAGASPPVAIYSLAARVAEDLKPEHDFWLEDSTRGLTITDSGWENLHRPLYETTAAGLKRPWSQYVEQALRVRHFLERDIDYVVVDDEVQIVDQNTGRIHPERTWRDGLHQAVEFREGVPLTPEKESEGRVSRQRYFQFYQSIRGMTGTVVGNEKEMNEFNGLEVAVIPTNQPCVREHLRTRFFGCDDIRNYAIAIETLKRNSIGQPVLLGTRTIRKSNQLSHILTELGVPHSLLNGVQDEQEADIISRAGEFGAVTIATNMAGRGTDIKLDKRALDVGGLCVLAAENNNSRRVDRQLAGRAARQGAPGTVQFYVSADDEIFVTGDSNIPVHIRSCANDQGEVPEHQRLKLQQQINRLQDQIERRHFERRRQMVQRDNWLESVLETLAKEK